MSSIYGLQMLSNGPLVIGSFLESTKVSVRVLNNKSSYKASPDGELLEIIGSKKPTVVGLSVNLLNALNSYEFVRKLKKRFPQKIILARELHTFYEPKEVTQQGFDITFVGETEISLTKSLRLLFQQKEPK